MFHDVPFGGLFRLIEDERNTPEQAIVASNCYVDTNGIRGRNGYRSLLPTNELIGSGSDIIQNFTRFRVSPTSARFVAVCGGSVYLITDPSNDEASDGSVNLLASGLFGPTDEIQMAQMGDYLYITSDTPNPVWRRMKPDYNLEVIALYPSPINQTHSIGTYSWSLYRSMVSGGQATVSGTDCAWNTTAVGLHPSWYAIVGTGGPNTNPLNGSIAKITFTNPIDASGCDWAAIGCSPPTSGSGNKHVYISISSDDIDYIRIGDIWDTPNVGGSPNLIWCNLTTVPETIKSSVKYIKFEVVSINDGTDLRYAVMGHMFVRSRTQANPIEYYVDIYNDVNQYASQLSPKISVTIGEGNTTLPTYVDLYMDRNNPKFTNSPADPLNVQSNKRIFTASAMPNRDGISAQITINGVTPSVTGPTHIRLWKQTNNGIRLVRSIPYPGANQSYSIIDTGSVTTLANEVYTSQGTPPRMSVMTSRASRIIGAYMNRLYISSFTPSNLYIVGGAKGTQPFPKFPDVAEFSGDGWSFDIAPGSDEVIQSLVNGDSLYILTNKAVYTMSDLEPNSPVYFVYQRGVVGKRAAIWAEQHLFWASYDGVYSARNRAEVSELSEPIRRYWMDDFGSSSQICLAYQNRKLYVFNGDKYLRYDFVTGRWTSGTLAHSVTIAVSFTDGKEHLALAFTNRRIAYWQSSASSDLMFGQNPGTSIPDWNYSTGYFWIGASTSIKSLVVDATNTIDIAAYKTGEDIIGRIIAITPTGHGFEVRRPFPVDITGYKWRFALSGGNDVILRRLLWEPVVDVERIAT